MPGFTKLDDLPVDELLTQYSRVMSALRARGVLRSANSPVADYAEGLVCRALELAQAPSSEKGYDAEAADGTRYEIKARGFSTHSRPSHFSAIRALDEGHFDYLACVLFEEDFSVRTAFLLPRAVVAEIATYRAHTNAHLVTIAAALKRITEGKDITDLVRGARDGW